MSVSMPSLIYGEFLVLPRDMFFFLEIGQKIQLILRYRQVSVCGFDNDEIRIMKKVVC